MTTVNWCKVSGRKAEERTRATPSLKEQRISRSKKGLRAEKLDQLSEEGSAAEKKNERGVKMESISKKLTVLDTRRQALAKDLDVAQKSSDYDNFRKIGNSYLGTILESIDLYIELIMEISSEPVAGELKSELSEIVKKGSKSTAIESQSEWISDDVSPLYEKVRQICACVYAAVAKIDQDANPVA